MARVEQKTQADVNDPIYIQHRKGNPHRDCFDYLSMEIAIEYTISPNALDDEFLNIPELHWVAFRSPCLEIVQRSSSIISRP